MDFAGSREFPMDLVPMDLVPWILRVSRDTACGCRAVATHALASRRSAAFAASPISAIGVVGASSNRVDAVGRSAVSAVLLPTSCAGPACEPLGAGLGRARPARALRTIDSLLVLTMELLLWFRLCDLRMGTTGRPAAHRLNSHDTPAPC